MSGLIAAVKESENVKRSTTITGEGEESDEETRRNFSMRSSQPHERGRWFSCLVLMSPDFFLEK